jgi:replicative DNA helicase
MSGARRRTTENGLVPIGKIISDYYDKLDYRIANKGEVTSVPSCLIDLDKLLGGGFQKSDMVVMAGRPGTGKTSLALGVAKDAALNHGKRVAVFSLEMSSEQLIKRLIAAETGIETQRQTLGDVTEEEFPLLIKCYDTLAGLPIFIDDTAGLTAYDLRTKARRLHSEHGLDLIVIDYLQLMQGDKQSENRQQEISFISRSIKVLARELNIPIIALSQLSRQVEARADKRPMLSDLRESGSIEQDSDVVLFIYRDELYNEDTEFPNIAEVIIAKHRNGPTCKVNLFFKKGLTQFTNLDIKRAEPLDY